MSQGETVCLVMAVAAVTMLLVESVRRPDAYVAGWLKAWANVRFGLRVCGWMIAAGAVVVAWSARPAVEKLAVMVQRRTVRQAR